MPPPYAPEPADPRLRAAALGSVFIALFLAWQALAHRSWVDTDTRPPAWDRGLHLELAQKPIVWQPLPPPDSPPWPPLYHLSLRALAGAGDPAEAALWLNWIYLALLCFGLLALGVYFRPDDSAAACALLVAASPGTLQLLHSHLPDLGVMAWVTLAYCAAVYSEGFRRMGPALAFAVLFAVGMLHKWTAFTYLLPALYQAARALEKQESRAPAAAALVFCVALTVPWYAANAAVLLPRLVAATGGFNMSAFAGLGAARYLLELVTWLGPVFFLFGFAGLLIPQYHRAVGQGWMMTAWFISAYAFWTVLPQRQLRFIMPAVPALAVAGTGAWPRHLLWTLAVLQLLAASNYNQGWIDEIRVPTPLVDLRFFPSDRARAEDWRAASALKAAAAAHRPEHKPAAIAVAANHAYLNPASVAYEARKLGAALSVAPFGMTEFVLLKTGGDSPVHRLVKEPRGWFKRAYDELERWKLPDGTDAVLYQQARFEESPLREDLAEFQFYESDQSGLEAENVSLRFQGWDSARGAYRAAVVRGSNVKLKGLEIGEVELELRDVLPAASYGQAGVLEDIRILRVGEVRVKRAQLPAGVLEVAMEAWAPGLDVRALELGDMVKAAGRFRGVAFAFTAAPKLTAEALTLEMAQAKLGPLNVSPAAMGALARFSVPLEPTPDKPFALRLPGLTAAGGKLTIP